MPISKIKASVGAAAILAASIATQADAVPVDLELSLLVDVSGSVNGSEFALQRDGYVAAFKNAAVQNKILGGVIGAIAVNYIYWSSDNQQQQTVGWTLIDSAQDAIDFADDIAAAPRPYANSTAVQSAIDYADPLFDNNGYEGTRKVMDVSGDGGDNDSPIGLLPGVAASNFCGQGNDYAINGIVISSSASVLSYYQNNVQCGPMSFTAQVDNFAGFEKAILNKLLREIDPSVIPLPGAAWLMIVGLGGLAAVKRRQKA